MWLCVFIVPKDVEVVFRKESVVDGVRMQRLCACVRNNIY